MGIYVNPNNENLRIAMASFIYVDKSMLIAEINRLVNTEKRFVCVSRSRRFGKTMAGNMLSAYFSKGCDSRELFAGLKIAKDPGFAERHGLDLIQIRSDGPRTSGVFHIQHVNAYHTGIKRIVNGHFRGVATKYLNSYLLWYNFYNYGGGTPDELMDRLAVDITHQRRRDIRSRPALPLLRAA